MIVLFEADRFETTRQSVTDWDDLFDIDVFLAVVYQTGTELAKSTMLAAA